MAATGALRIGITATGLALGLATAAASTGAAAPSGGAAGSVQARFDAARQETRVLGQAAPGLCYTFALPAEWRPRADGAAVTLDAVQSDTDIAVVVRSAHDLEGLPPRDLVSRDAAALQRDYEEMLGRPAQSSRIADLGPRASLFSATWVDSNLPAASGMMTVDALIVSLSESLVLEMTLDETGRSETRDALIRKVLSGLDIRQGIACRG